MIFHLSIGPPEKEVIHPSEAEVANGEADVEKNDNMPQPSFSPLHQNPKGIDQVGQRQNAWWAFPLFFVFFVLFLSPFWFLEEESDEAESKSKADGTTCKKGRKKRVEKG